MPESTPWQHRRVSQLTSKSFDDMVRPPWSSRNRSSGPIFSFPLMPWDAYVVTVRVVCHQAGLRPDETPSDGLPCSLGIGNHWSIYLMLNNKISIRLNIRADLGRECPFPGFVHCQVVMSICNYTMPFSCIKNWDFKPKKSFTVRWVWD